MTPLRKHIVEFLCAQRQLCKVEQFPECTKGQTWNSGSESMSVLPKTGRQKTWSWLSTHNGLNFSTCEMREDRVDDFKVLSSTKILCILGQKVPYF